MGTSARLRCTRWVALLAVLALVTTACGGEDVAGDDPGDGGTGADPATDPDPDADAGAESDDTEPAGNARDTTLVVGATHTPGGFDGDIFQPNMQNVVVQSYEPLLGYGATEPAEDGAREVDPEQLEGRLAESWEWSDDNLTLTLTLREGVQSFFGNELTAEDVVWSWEKSIEQGRTGNFIKNASNVESVEATGEHEVQFTVSAPSPILERALTLYVPSIYDSTEASQHATDDDPFATEWLAQNTAGFGPYHLESLEPDAQAVFVVNPNYYRLDPYFERVVYRAVPEASNRVSLVQTGQVDYIETPTFRQLADLRDDDRVKVQSVVGNQQARILMNPNFEPFDDVRVRQAINYAIDHDAMLDIVFEGLATQATSPVTPGFDCHTDEYWTYDRDLDRARELLEEAGHGDGLEIELEYSGVWWWEEPMAVQAQSQLAEVDIDVTLTRIPDDEMTSRAAIGERSLPFFTFYEQAIVLDPGYALFLNSHPDGASDRNDYGQSNPEFVDLVERGNQTLDTDERCELFDEAQRIHVEDASWVYGAMMGTHLAQKPELDGWVWWADNHPRWVDLHRNG
jgi:peptide/nickel transport system substrate-binding protein